MFRIQQKIWVAFCSLFLSLGSSAQTFDIEGFSIISELKSQTVHFVFQDHNGFIWASTTQGLSRFDGYKFQSFPSTQPDSSTIAVSQIYCDKQNLFWFWNSKGLLTQYNPALNKLQVYRPNPNDSTSIADIYQAGNQYFYFAQRADTIWVGTEKGLTAFDKKTGSFFTVWLHQWQDNTRLNSIQLAPSARCWLGSNSGLFVFDTQVKSKEKIRKVFGEAPIYCINAASDKAVWFLAEDGKLGYWENNNNGFNILSQSTIGISPKQNYAFYQASTGEQWIITDNDIVKITDISNSYFKSYKYSISKTAQANKQNSHQGMFEDCLGNLWAYTYNTGLLLYNRRDDTFEKVSNGLCLRSSISNSLIYQAMCDSYGNIWLATEEGLGKIDLSEIRNYVNHNMVAPYGKLRPIDPPALVITDIKVFNKSYKFHNNQNFSNIDTIHIKYSDLLVSIEFAALHFTAPERTRYLYMLEGLDPSWNTTDANQRLVTYTNLSPGTYTFRVMALLTGGTKISPGARLVIIVDPPYWQSWWFRLLIIIVAALFIFVFYFQRMATIKRQNAQLERQVKLRTELLEKANIDLEEKQKEIIAQNEEIQQQTEELLTQRDALEEQNELIISKNIQLQKTFDNVRILSEFGQKISSTMNISRINEMIYEHVNSMMEAPAFGIGLLNPTQGLIEYQNFIEEDKVLPYFARSVYSENSLSAWCLRNNKEVFIGDLTYEYIRYIPTLPEYKTRRRPTSLIHIPLMVEKRNIGILTVSSYRENAYNENDLNNLRSLAAYVSITLDNAHAYDIVQEQNEHITSGIRYAETIQRAILPVKSQINRYFESFIIYKPKEIVSGDFYWFTHIDSNQPLHPAFRQHELGGKAIVALVDCTGHGVPGAFMSLISSRLLSEIINEKKIYDPGKILEFIDVAVQLALNQDQTDNRDGFDIGLCLLEKIENNQTKITYSGARTDLVIKRKNASSAEVLRGDRKSVGGIWSKRSTLVFSNKDIVLDEGDMIYLLTDGYIDQNSPQKKKFGVRKLFNLIEENAHLPLLRQKYIFERAIDLHQGTEEQRDDITLWGIKL
jgi:serine phosphatase RsbU (regulator of sigma subunit)